MGYSGVYWKNANTANYFEGCDNFHLQYEWLFGFPDLTFTESA